MEGQRWGMGSRLVGGTEMGDGKLKLKSGGGQEDGGGEADRVGGQIYREGSRLR